MNIKNKTMKRMMVISLLLISLGTFAQKEQPKDTVKPKQPNYFMLIGQDMDFDLLKLAVRSPDDVAENVKKSILTWIDTKMPVGTDSTQQKPKEQPKPKKNVSTSRKQ